MPTQVPAEAVRRKPERVAPDSAGAVTLDGATGAAGGGGADCEAFPVVPPVGTYAAQALPAGTEKFFAARSAKSGFATELPDAEKPIWSETLPCAPFHKQLLDAKFPVPMGLPDGHQDSTLYRTRELLMTFRLATLLLEASPLSPEKMMPHRCRRSRCSRSSFPARQGRAESHDRRCRRCSCS